MNRFNLNLDINLDMVIDKYFNENNVSSIVDFLVAQEITESLEDIGYIIDEENFNVLADKNNKKFIITKINDRITIESFYDEDGKAKIHECDYLYVEYELLNEQESKLAVGHKEKKILIVYNI